MGEERTGVKFRHDYTKLTISKDSISKINQMVPGCGVAIGDFTGDGRPDLVFSAYSGVAFYRNDGDFKFTDISSSIGYPNDSLHFSTGINLVDIDADGDLDIFIARWQNTCRLLINDGTGHFTEQSAEFGLNFQDESVHSVFFDYDRDGLLDCYIVVYSNFYPLASQNRKSDSVIGRESEERQRSGSSMPRFQSPGASLREDQLQAINNLTPSELRHKGHPDRLFHNEGNGRFKDVSYASWIRDEGMGLSATVADIDLDGWPDLYIANDFNSTDLIYLNNKDGTFAENMKRMTRRASVFSMGSDVADLNGDGLPDIITTDMLPHNHVRRILNSGNTGDVSIYNPTYDSNQIMRNMVQINRGYNLFSDVGYMTGMAGTDWSWACLIQDFDLDGLADVYIANGYAADISNQDYVYNLNRMNRGEAPKADYLREPNFMFRQKSLLNFDDVSYKWGIADTSATFGAAYGDLDGDGDMDLVIANLDTFMFVYRNHAVERNTGNFINLVFKGDGSNTQGLGAKVRVVSSGKSYYRENYPIRGYQSCMDGKMAIGLGSSTIVDTILVQWADGYSQTITGIPAGQTITLERSQAHEESRSLFLPYETDRPLLIDVTPTSGIEFFYKENYFDDFKRYRMMPTRVSWGGPSVAVGDVNGDGLDDVVFGHSVGRSSVVYLQITEGQFVKSNVGLTNVDTTYEAQAMVLVDIDGDGDRDLVIAGGGAEFAEDDVERGIRIYLNSGKGQFTKQTKGVPSVFTNATTINACDYDNDGDFDLFIGGGVETDRYPFPARSYLLKNNGKGLFTDVTDLEMPTVRRMGIVRSALWTDVDNDGRFDLMLVGEWMPVTLLHNDGATFSDRTSVAGLSNTSGWWYSILGSDVDNDGDIDYVVGNMGLNSRYQTSEAEPIEMWAADFDENGSLDPLITYWWEGTRRIIRDRQKIFSQMPTLNRKFNEFGQFAIATLEEVIDKEILDSSYHRDAKIMESVVLLNDGTGRFTVRPLPRDAQVSPVLGIEALDLNGDEWVDLVISGNNYGAEDDVVRYDAGKGLVLLGNGDGTFASTLLFESGFISQFDTRGLVSVRNPGNNKAPVVLISAVNQEYSLTYAPTDASLRVERINPMKVSSVEFEVGKGKRRVEAYCGSAYRSQTSCNIVVPPGSRKLTAYRAGKKVQTKAVIKP